MELLVETNLSITEFFHHDSHTVNVLDLCINVIHGFFAHRHHLKRHEECACRLIGMFTSNPRSRSILQKFHFCLPPLLSESTSEFLTSLSWKTHVSVIAEPNTNNLSATLRHFGHCLKMNRLIHHHLVSLLPA